MDSDSIFTGTVVYSFLITLSTVTGLSFTRELSASFGGVSEFLRLQTTFGSADYRSTWLNNCKISCSFSAVVSVDVHVYNIIYWICLIT